jgi:hypothetical protein
MSQKLITAADVTDADMMVFSDMYKECYGMRPRFAYTKEDYAALANVYDEIQRQNEAEESSFLEHVGIENGKTFANTMAYYEWYEANQEREYAEQQEARKEKLELSRPGTKATINAWEHGLM